MGMNYYWRGKVCECCGRGDGPYHIGKSSHGWTFSFSTGDVGSDLVTIARCTADWRRWIAVEPGYVEDEEGRRIEPEEFWAMVESKKGGKVHALEHPSPSDWVDEEGNSFTDAEFS